MRTKSTYCLLMACFLFSGLACKADPIKIIWDTWGVPHIYANTEKDLFYAQGWAEMQQHANLLLELYGQSRGRGAEYWGIEHLPEDKLINALGFPELANSWRQQQDPQTKIMLNAFVAGMNDYIKAHPEVVKPGNKVILPITTDDINLHAMYVFFTRFVGGADLGRTTQWKDMGSNGYAVAPKRSASGHAMLVQNPHLPWLKEFTWFESQLNIGDKSIHGAHLLGFPGFGIAFNKDLGWTHTNNTLDNADTYELTLQDSGYILDNHRKDFTRIKKTLKIKGKDGAMSEQQIEVLSSEYGPVIRKGVGKALAIHMAGTDHPDALLQWWKMANSRNLTEFESALKMAQIPFWNVLYADVHGDIFYIFNGLVPARSYGDWYYWNKIIPSTASKDIWKAALPYRDLPKLKNPVTGWLQNANDPPWTCTVPQALHQADYPAYMSPDFMSMRSQRSANMLLSDSSITFDELVSYKLSTHSGLADRVLDDLFKAVDASSSATAKEAKEILMKWDRSADVDSKGMVLFFAWAMKFHPADEANYTHHWDTKHPTTTPYGLANPANAVLLLEQAANEVKTTFGTLDVPWGQYYRLKRNNINLPANGADGSLGIFRVASPGQANGKELSVGAGDSWVGVVEFGKRINARVLLSYGNSSEVSSPHNGDQLTLFSEKKLRDPWFYPEELEKHTERVEVLERKN
ncbi:acyl-homoserine-lactone acylase [Chitinophaga sp. CF118]|uniref:acylase n=1 Tax=Chitinophaga sp. CF118 TaxID=1884367 RepID=UPI0008EADDAC|nr:acylase [Chitinophaga sp. CF118]SFE17277.1 acyl-homoserine-lactone acylase [Chitinophaga sp. CF118]